MDKKRTHFYLSIAIGLSILGLYHFLKPKPLVVDTRPVVVAGSVLVQPMPVLLEAPGAVEPDHSVGIKAQVTGIIQKIAFEEGQSLKAGQLLFEMDPMPFLETLHQAQATLSRDEIILAQNERDAKRMKDLIGSEYVSAQNVEQAETTLRAQADLVLSDYANLRQAEIALAYTKIKAPIDGMSGQVLVQVGDLAVANDATPLVTINQIDPLLIDFSIPQNQLSSVLKAKQQGPVKVQVQKPDTTQPPLEGILVFIDNNVNPQTGTVLLKARVANPDQSLWPGMMLKVRVILSIEPNALTIPASALQIDQKGYFVYGVTDGKLSIHRVHYSRQIDNWVVIRDGLKENQLVLIQMAPNLVEGIPVRVQTLDPKNT